MHDPKSLIGILWILAFCFFSILGDSIVRYVTMQGFPSSEMLFIRSLIGTLLLLPFALKRRALYVSHHQLALYMKRGVFAFLSVALWFYILRLTDFTALIAVGFTAPLFTAALSILWLKEKNHPIKSFALCMGFGGAMVVINPFSASFNWYLTLGIVSAIFWAFSLIFTKQLSSKEHPITATFFFTLIITPLAFLLALPVWQWPSYSEWGWIMLFTMLGTCGQISLIKSFSYAELTTLMPFEFSQLIFAAFVAYVAFGDAIAPATLIGGAIIFASGYLIIRTERKRHRVEELETIS